MSDATPYFDGRWTIQTAVAFGQLITFIAILVNSVFRKATKSLDVSREIDKLTKENEEQKGLIKKNAESIAMQDANQRLFQQSLESSDKRVTYVTDRLGSLETRVNNRFDEGRK